MVVKSVHKSNHLAHLTEMFLVLKKHGVKLNVEKWAFGAGSEKFVGHLVTTACLAGMLHLNRRFRVIQ